MDDTIPSRNLFNELDDDEDGFSFVDVWYVVDVVLCVVVVVGTKVKLWIQYTGLYSIWTSNISVFSIWGRN